MNFDNLVEDAEKHGACFVHKDVDLVITMNELKALITKYILADRAESGEPVAYLTVPTEKSHPRFEKSLSFNKPHNRPDWAVIPLFTHAQPTPAQIAEIQAQALEDAAALLYNDSPHGSWQSVIFKLRQIGSKLRKGEPL